MPSEIMMSDQTDKVFAALVKATPEFKVIPKNKTAKVGTYSYKYADLSSIIQVAGPVLAKNGLAVSQFVAGGELVTLLVHSSGQYVGGGLECPKAGDPQKFGSWLTYLRRYMYNGAIGIHPDDDDDGAHAKAIHEEQQSSTEADAKPILSEAFKMIQGLTGLQPKPAGHLLKACCFKLFPMRWESVDKVLSGTLSPAEAQQLVDMLSHEEQRVELLKMAGHDIGERLEDPQGDRSPVAQRIAEQQAGLALDGSGA